MAAHSRIVWRLAAFALPGGVAGGLTAELLFFLNPDLPFGWLPVLRATVLYAALLGAAFAALLLPTARRRGWRTSATVTWCVALFLVVGSVVYLAHASRFAYYLPTGINQRLVKTGAWLAVLGLGAFYTALTHGLRQSPYSWRSRWGVVAMAIFALLVAYERRASYGEPPHLTANAGGFDVADRHRLLVIGLDSGTLDALLPLAEQGETPVFARLLHEGSYARLRTLQPTWRLPAWTTLSTGKYPFKHGLLSPRALALGALGHGGSLRLLPQWIGFEYWGAFGQAVGVADSRARRAQCVFELLTRAGLAVGAVSWPATSPLAPELAFGASDRFFGVGGDATDVLPVGASSAASALRRNPADAGVDLAALENAGAPAPILNAAAADLWRQGVALELLRRRASEVDGLWLQFRGLGTVSARLYGGYVAARQEGSQQVDDQRSAQVLSAYYGLLDRLVGELLRAQEFDFVALVSPYGVSPEAGWRRGLALLRGERSVAGSSEDGPDGMLVLYGPGVRARNLVSDAGIADVAPTLLYALGMPVGDDLDGKVLTGAFTEEFLAGQALTFVPTYESRRP